MKKTFTTASSKLCSAQVLRLCVCVFLMASLLSAWQTAHAAAPSDASPAAAATTAAATTTSVTSHLPRTPLSPLFLPLLSLVLQDLTQELRRDFVILLQHLNPVGHSLGVMPVVLTHHLHF